jgi:hypothetical protein
VGGGGVGGKGTLVRVGEGVGGQGIPGSEGGIAGADALRHRL